MGKEGVTPGDDEGGPKTLSIRCTDEIYRDLKERAIAENRTVSKMGLIAITDYLSKNSNGRARLKDTGFGE